MEVGRDGKRTRKCTPERFLVAVALMDFAGFRWPAFFQKSPVSTHVSDLRICVD